MSWRCEPLSFAYFSLRQAKKSRCPPRTGATLIDQYQFKERPKIQIKERPTPQADKQTSTARQPDQQKANTAGTPTKRRTGKNPFTF
jgi:hypothetical protein